MNREELFELREDIERAKQTVSELNGRKTQMLSDLQKTWRCKNVADAQRKLKKMRGELVKIEEQIEANLEELDERYADE